VGPGLQLHEQNWRAGVSWNAEKQTNYRPNEKSAHRACLGSFHTDAAQDAGGERDEKDGKATAKANQE
jgi:hypothetical protein